MGCSDVALIMSFISTGKREKGNKQEREKKKRKENKNDKGISVSGFPNRFCY